MKNRPVKARSMGWILGQEDALEKEMATHSSILAKSWKLLSDETTTAATHSHSSILKHTHTHTHTHTLMLTTLFLIPSPHIITHSRLLSLFPSCYLFSFYISGVQNLHSIGTWGNDDVSGNTPTKDSKVIISTQTFSK